MGLKICLAECIFLQTGTLPLNFKQLPLSSVEFAFITADAFKYLKSLDFMSLSEIDVYVENI